MRLDALHPATSEILTGAIGVKFFCKTPKMPNPVQRCAKIDQPSQDATESANAPLPERREIFTLWTRSAKGRPFNTGEF
ncbi:MAG: hypothetical protein ACJARR_003366 [Pseudophaeobacter arcticus]